MEGSAVPAASCPLPVAGERIPWACSRAEESKAPSLLVAVSCGGAMVGIAVTGA